MNNQRPTIPMRVPSIGGQQQQQIQLGPGDTIETKCPCGGELFDIAYRHMVLPSVSAKNPTGKDMPIKVEVFVCRGCGAELGKKVE